ncbi:7b3f5b15-100d-4b9a-b2af-3304976d2fbf [Sclerotinia trifoliorum]|uniref:7b3f5b15-100d-4b9a-b2af-3304976d2fbf n=1 Tax=Sclerotinia trifoliorum TaxID=28548 RepID=A0A8H2W3H3_9HELO|nr:7b3f5b15-100d-4b9a-b2af-3304976d2fbf [Sclerotinia trifoliorum]
MTTTTLSSTSTSIGGVTDGGGLFPTFVPSDIAGQTVLGCPISSFMSLDSKCPITGTGLPACATQTANFDEPCCGSLSAFATSVGDCYSSNAPACLNLDELSSSLTAFSATATDQQVTNPCARFASTTTTSAATETGGQAAQTGETGGSGATEGSTTTGTATGSASAASSTDSSSGSAKERGNMGLKTVATLALMGSLGVLWL